MKPLIFFVLTLLVCFNVYGQEQPDTSCTDCLTPFRMEEYPKTTEALFFTKYGMGFRMRKDFGKLTRDLGFYAIDDPYASEATNGIVQSINDTALFVTDYGVSASETGIRAGVSTNGGLMGFSLNGLVGYAKRERSFQKKYVNLTRDSATGQISYINRVDGSHSVMATQDMYTFTGTRNTHRLNYMKVGLSPGFEMHFRHDVYVITVNVVYDLGWYFKVGETGGDPIGIPDRASTFYQHGLRFFIGLGMKHKKSLFRETVEL